MALDITLSLRLHLLIPIIYIHSCLAPVSGAFSQCAWVQEKNLSALHQAHRKAVALPNIQQLNWVHWKPGNLDIILLN